MTKYKISGMCREVGAIGVFEPFEIVIESHEPVTLENVHSVLYTLPECENYEHFQQVAVIEL
jgi:hypothetical protein